MGRAAAVLTIVLCCSTVAAIARAAPPPGATARCVDGTYSTSAHRSGTCSHHGGVAVWLGAAAAPPAAIATGPTVLVAPRRATSGCVRGVRPDRRCSPGAYDEGLTAAILCSSSFSTSEVRNVPQSEKFAVEREYGLPARLYGRTIEIDHIVPLELGGSNGIANLFPEPGGGPAGYEKKDRLENRLHAMVCAGRIGLRDAQTRIAANWQQLYTAVFRLG